MTSRPPGFLKGAGDFFFRFRNGLFPVAGAVLVLVSRPATFPASRPLNDLLASVGAVSALAGQSFRLMVIGYDYIKRGGKDGKVYADHLVTGGFYSACRNPMYVGNVLIVTGFALAYGSLASYLFVIPFFLFVYVAITVAEETYLSARFGAEYDEYCRRVPRILPRFGALGEALKGSRYDWRKAIRKDYGQVFQTFGLLALIGLGRAYTLEGGLSGKSTVFFAVIAAAAAAFFVVSRFLKKTNRLVSPGTRS